MDETTQCLSFCVDLIPLDMTVNFTYIVVNDNISTFAVAEQYASMYLYSSMYIHYPFIRW